MKFHKHLALLLIILSSISFAQKKVHLGQAVNIAGKQRMLGQRMAKDKLFLEVGKKTKFVKQEQQKAMAAFELGIKILKDFAPTREVRHKVNIQEFTYKIYKDLILDGSKKSLQEVIACNTLFLAICDDVVTSIIEYSKTAPNTNLSKNKKYVLENIAKATGASGKLRYLTQRLTLYFCLNAFDVKKVTPEEIDRIVKTMEKNLNYLTVLEFNTLEIDDSLSEVLYEWAKLKETLYKNGKVNLRNNNIKPTDFFELCNSILAKANATTKMYADLNKS